MRDPIAILKDAARVAFARGLSALSDVQDVTEASSDRALRTLGLPTRPDIDRLHTAVTDLDRAASSF